MKSNTIIFCVISFCLQACNIIVWQGSLQAQMPAAKMIIVYSGWANNSINTVPFRKNSLVTFLDTQYIAYYNQQGYVVAGKRKTGSADWQLRQTQYRGNVTDAHNSISLMIDGAGYLHLCWDHHNSALRYCKSVSPGSLILTNEMPMTGDMEAHVTYPEFYKMPNGNLLFLYRDGSSGNGNLIINRYDIHLQKWQQVQSNLIDGEGQRNAYWQACVDTKGVFHISWVWRESPDVASNHDLCYASSADAGKTWNKSTGEKYSLPIKAASAEYICHIPQNSDLINQTTIYADEESHPFIASYWRQKNDSAPQYHLVFKTGEKWQIQNTGFRNTVFSLSGTGTKRISVSRPQLITYKNKQFIAAVIIFRDNERGGFISAATNNNINKNSWQVQNLTTTAVGSWEPSYDTELWKQRKLLNLFVQFTEQQDSEGSAVIMPQLIRVLEWYPKN